MSITFCIIQQFFYKNNMITLKNVLFPMCYECRCLWVRLSALLVLQVVDNKKRAGPWEPIVAPHIEIQKQPCPPCQVSFVFFLKENMVGLLASKYFQIHMCLVWCEGVSVNVPHPFARCLYLQRALAAMRLQTGLAATCDLTRVGGNVAGNWSAPTTLASVNATLWRVPLIL